MVGNLAEQHTRFFPRSDANPGKLTSERIAVLGLGYVGLPVAVAFARRFENVVGFDIATERVMQLRLGKDRTGEIDQAQLLSTSVTFTAKSEDLADASVFIVAVPTPVDHTNRPDLGPLRRACHVIAPFLRENSVVVFESTVFPGATEEVCATELALHSGLIPGEDFHVAYSPERINPGEKVRGIDQVTKIVAAEDAGVLERVAEIYEQIVKAGVHRSRSIKVAEAAKVFENTQRDVNIALTNEFSRICETLGIRTKDVLEATGTKWNALPFSPGLVGGHCIGVDPYYLTTKAEEMGVFPELMLASRRTNDRVPIDIAGRAIRFLTDRDLRPSEARVGILGVTFKENVPDLRNSKVMEIEASLATHGIQAMVHDPIADPEPLRDRGLRMVEFAALQRLDVLILAVPHRSYLISAGTILQDLIKPGGVLMDVRSAIQPAALRSDITYWSL